MSQMIIKPLQGSASIGLNEHAVIALDQEVPAKGKVLVHIDVWKASKDAWKTRAEQGDLGVWLSPDDDPETLAADLDVLKLVAFHFPAFKFGQPYSGAVILRTRYGFKGEIRAFGDIWRDQMFYLARCGFTQFIIQEGKSLEDAVRGFDDFKTPYQSSADGQLPIFSRRVA